METPADIGREGVLERIRDRVLRFAKKRVTSDAADDVAQETIIVLMTQDSYKNLPEDQLVYAGMRVAANKAYDWYRRNRFVKSFEGDEADIEEKSSRKGPEKAAIDKDLVEEYLRQLPEDCRRIIRLRAEGYSHEEIARELVLPSPGAAATRLNRCREIIKNKEPR